MNPGRESALAEIVGALHETAAPLPPPAGAQAGVAADHEPARTQCALCLLAVRSVERSLRSYFAEFVNDPQLRLRFRKSRGFCALHTPLLARCGDALGVAILYSDLADETRRSWSASGGERRPGALARLLSRPGRAPCPGCETESEADARYSSALADGLRSAPDLWREIEESAGLCAKHTESVAAAASPSDAARLLAIEGARLDLLFAELEEFVRKNDYRFRGEPWGLERDAWRRALLRLRRP
jgi:hypothetical protein